MLKKVLILFLISIVYIYFPKNALANNTISDWTTSLSLPYPMASGVTFTSFNKLYVTGGSPTLGASHAEVLETEIQTNGILTQWLSPTSLDKKLIWHTVANNQNFVYVLGGYLDNINGINANVDDVFYAKIDGDGNITNWNNTTHLPVSIGMGASVIIENKIYYAGGSTNREEDSSATSNIWVANINTSDGTLSDWSIAGSLPQPMLGFGMIEHNGHLIILGGKTRFGSETIYLSEVKKALINTTTGAIGNWTLLPSLPDPVYRAGITKIGNLIVSAGGYYSSAITLMDKVNFTEVDSTGNIAPWTESDFKLPQPTCCFSLSSWNNYIYITGGFTGTYVNDVYMSKIEDTSIVLPNLPVPILKQYIGGWENNLYGHTKNTIGQFGCALTSTSMVLKYFNHNIDPGDLNSWLKNQKDGYIRNNLINWLAISRYTKIHESTESPTLEYSRSTPNTDKILANLYNSLPTIVKVPGHFVVTKSQTKTSYGINDPGYSDRNELSSFYPVTDIKSLSTYIPSQTDLSYIMFVGDENLKFELFDSLGNPIDTSKIQTFLEEPINELNGSDTSGESLSILIFPKPQHAQYILKITGPEGQYQLESYLYNLDGNVIYQNLSGYIFNEDENMYQIDFDQNNKVFVLYSEIYKKLRIAKEKNLISNKGVFTAIKAQIEASEKLANKNMLFPSEIIIRTLVRQIQNLTPKFINQEFSLSLQSDLKSLTF